MGSVTPKFGYPYPVGTDRVMDGDDAIAALATAIENHTAGADAACVAGASIVLNVGRVYRRGPLGLLVFNALANANVAANATFLTIPAGYRPLAQWRGAAFHAGGSVALVVASLDGTVTCNLALNNAQSVHGSLVYPIA